MPILLSSADAGPRQVEFEPNWGQAAPQVQFLVRGPGYIATLRQNGSLTFEAAAIGEQVHFDLLGAGAQAAPVGAEELPSWTHYYSGNDPSAWRTDIPHFARVFYSAVYAGVDLLYYGQSGRIEYEFRVAPGYAPGVIRFRSSARLSLDPSGDLVLHTRTGAIRHSRPVAYQIIGNRRREVPAAFQVVGSVVSYSLGEYDRRHALVIDPAVQFSTFLGGAQWDAAYGIASNGAGDVFVTGDTASPTFPGRAPGIARGRDAFVTKMRGGSNIVYTTILAGTGSDAGRSVAVDEAGNVYVAGAAGDGFPTTTNAVQRTFGGIEDAFVAKLDPTGRLVYCTYLGAGGADGALGIAISAAANAYVTGYTESVSFPTSTGAPQRTHRGGIRDAFLAQISHDGSALVYATLLGGGGYDVGYGVAVDAAGNATMAGSTDSMNLSTQNAFQSAYGGNGDAMVASLNPAGSAWNWVTYAGGSSLEQASGVALDSAGRIYIAGATSSANFPVTSGAYQRGRRADYDLFVMKMTAAGSLVYSTAFGGSGADSATALAVDPGGAVWAGGFSSSIDFPMVQPAQNSYHGVFDAFVVKIAPDGGSLQFSTYLGGSGDDRICGLARDGFSGLYLAGYTSSTDFPTTSGTVQPAPPAGYNAFVAQIGSPPAVVSVTPSSGSGSRQVFAVKAVSAGVSDIGGFLVLVNSGFTNLNGCFLVYNAQTGFVDLVNDQASAMVGAQPLGGSGGIENGQCRVNLATSSVSTQGNELILSLDLSFKAGFGGAREIYAAVGDRGWVFSSWLQYGSWTAQ